MYVCPSLFLCVRVPVCVTISRFYMYIYIYVYKRIIDVCVCVYAYVCVLSFFERQVWSIRSASRMLHRGMESEGGIVTKARKLTAGDSQS